MYTVRFLIFRFKQKSKKTLKKAISPPFDINTANAEDLQKIHGIGQVLSQRIIRYRERLQGFALETQLAEVYGLSPEVVARLQDRCSIMTKPTFKNSHCNKLVRRTFKSSLPLLCRSKKSGTVKDRIKENAFF